MSSEGEQFQRLDEIAAAIHASFHETPESFTQTVLPKTFEFPKIWVGITTLQPSSLRDKWNSRKGCTTIKEGTASVLVQSGLADGWSATRWNATVTCLTYTILRQTDKQLINKTMQGSSWSDHYNLELRPTTKTHLPEGQISSSSAWKGKASRHLRGIRPVTGKTFEHHSGEHSVTQTTLSRTPASLSVVKWPAELLFKQAFFDPR